MATLKIYCTKQTLISLKELSYESWYGYKHRDTLLGPVWLVLTLQIDN